MWVGGTVPPRRNTSAVVGPVYTNLHPECELPCPNDFRDKDQTWSTKINCGSIAPILHNKA